MYNRYKSERVWLFSKAVLSHRQQECGGKNKINKIIKKSSPYSAVFLCYGSEQRRAYCQRAAFSFIFSLFFFFNRFLPVAAAVNIVGTFKRARYGQGYGGGEMAVVQRWGEVRY